MSTGWICFVDSALKIYCSFTRQIQLSMHYMKNGSKSGVFTAQKLAPEECLRSTIC